MIPPNTSERDKEAINHALEASPVGAYNFGTLSWQVEDSRRKLVNRRYRSTSVRWGTSTAPHYVLHWPNS